MKKWIDGFVRRVDLEGLPVQAVLAYQSDALVAEHHWAEDVPRNIYSHTKSFMSTAVGMAIGDGVLSLEDRPTDFFPEALPQEGTEALRHTTLRHLLTMSSGFGKALLMSPGRAKGVGAPDYVRYLFAQPLQHAPGEAFVYSNGDSYLAGRMVEARVGCTLREYLATRLFAPLGIPYPDWEHCPMGHTFGASGLWLRIRDMAKLGRLYANGGMWKGQPLVDPAWIAQATSLQIETKDAPDNPWHRGYGYQFWLSPYPASYRADGMYGQITTVLPKAGAVVSIQCGRSNLFGKIQAALDEEVLSRL